MDAGRARPRGLHDAATGVRGAGRSRARPRFRLRADARSGVETLPRFGVETTFYDRSPGRAVAALPRRRRG